MKKSGLLSLIVYILYTLGGGALALVSKINIDNLNANGGGWEGLGYAIVMILGIILAGIGVIGIILKGIHLKTEWGFFGVLCILLDLAFAAVLVASVMSNDGLSGNDPALLVILAIPVVTSFVGNILSMKR